MAEQELQRPGKSKLEWLLFFYSVPSRPVNNRMRIWRRLIRAGAVQFKGAAYILPYDEEHYELLQWLVSEVTALGGEGAFVRAENIETTTNKEIMELFNRQRERDYHGIDKRIEEFERKIDSIKKGGGIKDHKQMLEEFEKCLKQFDEIRAVDFFSSKAGSLLKKKLDSLQSQIREISGAGVRGQNYVITPKRINDFQNRVWATRKKPFVDRMASAWLIRKFVDNRAVFKFIDEKDIKDLAKEIVTFDIRDGEFTHIGDMCTFEVLIKSFGIKDRIVKKIAGIVHELDMKDDKYTNPEAKGIEEILTGIRKTAKGDADALERGMAVFEMLYASKT